jgi:hypothetical protein
MAKVERWIVAMRRGWRRLLAPPVDWRRHCYRMAIVLAVLTLLTAAPALRHWRLATAPGWSRLMLLAAGLQLAYLAWLATNPDWSAVWVVMIAFAAAATMLAVAGTMTLMAPTNSSDLPLGLEAVRRPAAAWCLVGTAICAAAAYYCGHVAQMWMRQSVIDRRAAS